MEKLYFITGSEGKLNEARRILGEVESLNIDLTEIQSVNTQEIIKHKLEEAKKHHSGRFIVEDTSLYLDGMKGLPGPLIKFFLKTINLDGVFKLTKEFGSSAQAKTVIGYYDGTNVSFYEGVIEGKIVEARGENGFGWDKIFVPNGYEKTFAEMTAEEKDAISMRKIAFSKLKEFLAK